MIVFPNCKINLGLNILRKRDDGFHDLETVFYPILKLKDALEIQGQDKTREETNHLLPVDFKLHGITVDGPISQNLCVKAYDLLKSDFPTLAEVHMHLLKSIPMGAGLGGGSADGAFTLRLLNEKFHLKLTTEQLLDYALRLGSDCPFFIINKPCFAWGRGEMMQPLQLDLNGYWIVLINPGIHINTGWAFGNIKPKTPTQSLRDLIKNPIETWKETIFNDFEQPVMETHPLIGTIKTALYKQGAVYASMSGSGSTVFGIFKLDTMPKEKLFPNFLELHLAL